MTLITVYQPDPRALWSLRPAALDGPEERSSGQREVLVRDRIGLILAFGEEISPGAG
jgi:hypothetical protein